VRASAVEVVALKDLGNLSVFHERVEAESAEELEDAPRYWPSARRGFAVERQVVEISRVSLPPSLAFDQRLHQDGEKTQKEKRLDPPLGLQE